MKDFTVKDKRQIENHGLTGGKVCQNLKTFEEGIPFVPLIASATLENGIRKLTDNELKFHAEKYEKESLDVVKFVPASGAATRMFKDLLAFLQGFGDDKLVGLKKLLGSSKYANVNTFFEHITAFAFYDKLLSETRSLYPNFEQFSEDEKKYYLLKSLLDEDKLNFSNLPKGLIPFHKYASETRTAFEEHFVETVAYIAKNNLGKLHFTVAEKHLEKFEKQLEHIQEKSEKKQALTKFEVNFSFQKKTTDTIAVDMENHPFRDENKNLVFRPSGHGALLENLNQIDADLIFIKNIDNVSTENNLALVSTYKKALAGLLLGIQKEAFGLLKELQNGLSGKEEKIIQKAKIFLKEKLNVPHEPKTLSELKDLLNRPIRVCGMVKNTGAPGGGPFWVKNASGTASLQIVETAQINLKASDQHEILKNATHFNPVDLVCGVKNFKGEKFDLSQFSDPKKGFITEKSMNGRDLKALELPGLWNGAMHHWNTIFIEVPLETFNPVKTVMDLLKPKHQ